MRTAGTDIKKLRKSEIHTRLESRGEQSQVFMEGGQGVTIDSFR